MKANQHTPEQIITKLREADALLAGGQTVAVICKRPGVSQHAYYRWRGKYGDMKVDEATRLKELEREHQQLKKLVAEQAPDLPILREVARGNALAPVTQAAGSCSCHQDVTSLGAARLQSPFVRAPASALSATRIRSDRTPGQAGAGTGRAASALRLPADRGSDYVKEYNHERPHSALAYRTPAACAAAQNINSPLT